MSGYLQLQFSAKMISTTWPGNITWEAEGPRSKLIAVQGWAMPAIIVNQSPKLCSVCHSKWNATVFNTFHANSDNKSGRNGWRIDINFQKHFHLTISAIVGGCLISYDIKLTCMGKLGVIWPDARALQRRSLRIDNHYSVSPIYR